MIVPKTFRYALDPETSVATITLDRSDRLNALTFDVYAELTETFNNMDTEPGVRAVLLTGAGRAFCSGGDVDPTFRTSRMVDLGISLGGISLQGRGLRYL